MRFGPHYETALHLAASAGNGTTAAILISRGAMIERRDGQHRVPLHKAAVGGHEDVLRLLLDKGADVDAEDQEGRTALYMAARQGHLGVVQLLLERGANAGIRGGLKGESPHDMARKYDHVEIARLLEDHVMPRALGEFHSAGRAAIIIGAEIANRG